ncbi:MAG: glycosyltransferase family 4 protein [Anaerolineaceae bacterium]|nr:glycosyltransferase family 4 protein [Anaerolineaceae bacterium]MDD4043250.1 glycosyltransferase family 4 protein [Anaerolineaceae bacterium]MDD4577466.1 glycosyltransferase family 4 protein [Anaerolineaceae bacterium]
MKVCYFGTYRSEYNRNKIMIAALKNAGVEVITCQVNLWHSIEDRENVTTGGWRSPKFWWRVIKAYTKLIIKSFSIGKFDVMVLGYPGQFDVFLARVICSLKSKPLVWDVFMSVYLVAMERGLEGSRHSAVRFLKRIEKKALKSPDLLIQDTSQYVEWFQQTYGVEPDRFRLVPTGADDSIFKPITQTELTSARFRVLYYGTFIANHGLDHILDAAKILSSRDELEFLFIGEGPEKARIVRKAESENLEEVTFLGWTSQNELVEQISRADLCLGAFGSTPQSMMTVQNKIYECMACGKAVITGTSPAIRAQFTDEVELKICERNGVSIAGAILSLKGNPELLEKIGHNARQSFVDHYSIAALGKTFREHLESLL